MHDFKRYPELTNSQMRDLYYESPHRQITEDFEATVIKVHDGDTIKVRWDGRDFDFPIRFLNLAAPELNEKGGIKSRDWLEKQILGKEVSILIDPNNRVEKWGRLLGTVVFEGINLAEASINEGYAISWADRKDYSIPNIDKELKKYASL